MTHNEPFDPLSNKKVWREVASLTMQPMFDLAPLAEEYRFDIRHAIAMLKTFTATSSMTH